MTINSSVKLIWITPDAEKHIMYCARVSNPKRQTSSDPRLLFYCIKHKHWSIFEMASMCVEINTSRTIARQILRHRSFSFQEFSQRYQEVDTESMIQSKARRQDTKNRQNSIDDLPQAVQDWFSRAQEENWQRSRKLYKEALDKGIAKECARIFLPEGQTGSRLYMTGNIRSWIHYVTLRQANGTQLEHAEIARQIFTIMQQHIPTICAAITQYN